LSPVECRFTSRLPPKQVKIDADIDIDRLPEILRHRYGSGINDGAVMEVHHSGADDILRTIGAPLSSW
jgi:hypothetical protein